MNIKRYFLIKQTTDNQIIYIDYDKVNGFKIKPKNNIKYDGIQVNKLILIKPSFIEKILRKKIKKKLDIYLQYIIKIMDENDDEAGVRHALNEITRYRSIVINNYRNYLDKKYVDLLLKKLDLLENEIKMKVQSLEINRFFTETSKKSR